MSLRRGFKAEAERISIEVRTEMRLRPEDRLDPFALAKHLSVPVIGIRDAARLVRRSDLGSYFLTEDVESLSAITLFQGRKRIVLHNDRHAATRQASNVAHEISHCLLEHSPEPAVGPDGCRMWNREVEMEAEWLGGALLMPRAGALKHARAGLTPELIADHFGVSLALCRWRLQHTGILSQLQRYASLRRAVRRAAAR